jgi:hypothetical protein
VIAIGFEPMTHRLEICCSIQLSYATVRSTFDRSNSSNLKKQRWCFFVGVARFELATFCSQSRRDDRATLHPEVPIRIQRRERDSNPRYRYQYVSLANWWFQPLTHLSVSPKRFANIGLSFGIAIPTPKIIFK